VEDGRDGEPVVAGEIPQKAEDMLGRGGVERRDRLARENHRGALAERAGDRDSLLSRALNRRTR
jgi:hypothetical protein